VCVKVTKFNERSWNPLRKRESKKAKHLSLLTFFSRKNGKKRSRLLHFFALLVESLEGFFLNSSEAYWATHTHTSTIHRIFKLFIPSNASIVLLLNYTYYPHLHKKNLRGFELTTEVEVKLDLYQCSLFRTN
jgi:hypothetical protein